MYSYKNELRSHEEIGRQLVETIGDTAAIALYLGNKDMISEVAESLLKNDIIKNVMIKDRVEVFYSSMKQSSRSQHEKWIEYQKGATKNNC